MQRLFYGLNKIDNIFTFIFVLFEEFNIAAVKQT